MTAVAGDPQHVFLVDGSGFIFRAFHGLPAMSRPDGTPVNAVYGFTTMLLKLLSDTDADHVAVIFDAGRLSFRNDIYPEYKAHRPPAPEDLVPQFPLIRDVVAAFNVPSVEMEGFEADDLIATYATQAVARGARVTIVSSDKDLMQLVGERVEMLDTLKNRTIRAPEVLEKFGVAPDKVVDVQALCGDPTDNVPGVPGIGVKTAAQLIGEYGDLDSLLARASEIKQPKRRETLLNNAELARISRELVRLKCDVPVTESLDSFAKRPFDRQVLADFLAAQGFKSIVARLGGSSVTPTAAPAVTAPVAVAAPVVAQYELVTSVEVLEAWVAEATRMGTVAFDTETTGLDPLRAELVGVSLATAPGRACYIPIKHDAGPAQGSLLLDPSPAAAGPDILGREVTLAKLAPLLADASVLKIGHNIKYDMQVMAQAGLTVTAFDDTMLLSYVLDGASHGHGMDELAKLHLDHDTIKFADVCGTGKNQITFDRVPLDKALAYAAEDADITLRLHGVLKARLLAERMVTVYETLERPLVPVIVAMEAAGIKVDRTALMALSAEFGGRMAELEVQIQTLAGREFNVGSPQQLGKVLFEDMSLPGGKKTKTGQWGTGADALEELAAQGHDLPARVLDWRQLSKLKGTYTDALVAQINGRTGRVHTSFALALTTTGRLSSSDPNLQNIPIRSEEGRKIRHAFIAEPGHVLLSADYSQIELRLVAHVAGIKGLIQAFHDGADIHAITAAQVFGVPVEGMDPMLRRRAKAINFGIIYGISAFGLAQQLGISNGEAKSYIDAYFGRYPEIRDFMERTKEEARANGFVLTPFGRKVFTPGIKDKNGAMRAFAERAAINGPIQGGAADIIKRAMIRLPAALAAEGLKARLLLQVHDELVLEVPVAEQDATRAVVCRVMESAAQLDVPLVAEAGFGTSWGDAH
ncbi:fused DNA polymerase I 5'-_3' exonuclease; 3'-_5' polymerase; 3'-_5' exonuclease [Magnetospirillum gryphiswaldense MSR-1 v2]|uniref:DNA polymerase I n=1 Tax=Magnetospirillum gryphiswaldense (strain DSM 6361 / JCM 21280 / NBRC 15271 / MSR-1) TaxID=431944 RepID=V6F4M9_MAGGM|nr:fused DNA polymerase I 5'->3' exonuclease; 3'->5' polymerase; 3'->5' exonuclease [Magnetospirillum gryphiswaldense MSR-1 v2]